MKNSSTGISNRRYLAIFAGIVLSFAVATELLLHFYVVPMDGLAKLVHRVYIKRRSGAIIGDSQSNAFMYDFLDHHHEYVHLGFPGLPPQAMQILVREFSRHHKVRRVIIAYGPQFFSTLRSMRGTWGFDKDFVQNRLNLPIKFYLFEPTVNRDLAKMGTILRYFPSVPDHPVINRNAIELIPAPTARQKNAFPYQQRVMNYMPQTDFADSAAFHAFADMLKQLQQQGTETCIVHMPVIKDLETSMERFPIFAQANDAVRELAKSTNARYVDFHDLPIDYTENLFEDSSHLNEAGSNVFVPAAVKRCFASSHKPHKKHH